LDLNREEEGLDLFERLELGQGQERGVQTERVVARWYRAPEIIVMQQYDERSDMWSMGCVFAELLGLLDAQKDHLNA
jgi:serine/threonine protein kinase